MKTIVKILALTFVLITLGYQYSYSQISAGAGMAFGSDIEQVGVQADLHYRLVNQPAFSFGGGFIYYFPKDDHNFYEMNVNGAFHFYEEFMFKSYLYTGLNYARSEFDFNDGSVSDSAFGLNLGIGAEYDFGRLLAFGDLKYVISDFDQAVFSIGLRLPF